MGAIAEAARSSAFLWLAEAFREEKNVYFLCHFCQSVKVIDYERRVSDRLWQIMTEKRHSLHTSIYSEGDGIILRAKEKSIFKHFFTFFLADADNSSLLCTLITEEVFYHNSF